MWSRSSQQLARAAGRGWKLAQTALSPRTASPRLHLLRVTSSHVSRRCQPCSHRWLSTLAAAPTATSSPPPAPSASASPTFSIPPSLPSVSSPPPARVCIVGSGPAGMYTAKYLLKDYPTILIDIFEALPVPFGLVRFGVAPDHPEVKSVSHDFQSTLDDPRVRFFGHVRVGSPSLPLSSLLSSYHAVILAYGASSSRRTAIPGSHLHGIHPARAFVDWYNGHPNTTTPTTPITVRGPHVVVVGQGNVAVDCARLLVKGGVGMKGTDVADHALQEMEGEGWKGVQRVTLIGRRGPVQAAFTTAEFREIAAMPDVRVEVREEELRVGDEEPSQREMADSRPKKRKLALIKEVALTPLPSPPPMRTIAFRFLLSPVEYLEDPAHPGWVGAVRCQRMALITTPPTTPPSPPSTTAVPTPSYDTLPASTVLESIGYLSVPLPDLPFDSERGVVPSVRGRVVGEGGTEVGGLYVSGWLKRGPVGIIGSNIGDARETVGSVVERLREGEGVREERGGVGVEEVRGACEGRLVDKEGWRRIDEWEKRHGQAQGRGRVKVVDVEEMLRIATST